MAKSPYPMLQNRVNWNYIGVDKEDKGVFAKCRYYGLPGAVVNQRPFMLSGECRSFGVNSRAVLKNDMLEKWAWLWESPLYAPYVLCISSVPDIAMARLAAARLFMRAFDLHEEISPLWYNVGGFRDEISAEQCDFLVLYGVNDSSSRYKKDALFNLLTEFESIPRVVVTSSPDPMRLMGLVRHEFHHAMNLGRLPLEEELDYAHG